MNNINNMNNIDRIGFHFQFYTTKFIQDKNKRIYKNIKKNNYKINYKYIQQKYKQNYHIKQFKKYSLEGLPLF